MRDFFSKRYQIASWLGLFLTIIILVAVSGNAIRSFHTSQVAEIKKESQQNLKFISGAIHEKLQKKNYVSAKTFLRKWAEQRSEKNIELTLTTANGYVLGKYLSNKKPKHTISFTETIPYSYRDSATLQLRVDLTRAYLRTAGIIKIVGALVLVFSLLLACALWLYLRKYALSNKLSEHSQSLAKTVDALHSEVKAHVEAEKALEKSEKEYRNLINNLPTAVVVHAADSSVIISNPMASTLLGLTVDQMNGKKITDPGWSFLRPDGKIMPVDEYPANLVLKSKKPVIAYESGISRPGFDEPIWVLCHAYPVFNKVRELEKVIVTFIDITERNKAIQDRLEFETQLNQKHKMEAVGYMAGGMAHNFNNNLAIILGNLELSELKVQDPMVQNLLKNAKIGVLRSRDLVKKIITYSRKGLQNKAPVTLLSVVDETIELMSSTLPTTIKLHKNIKGDCTSTFVLADGSQIQEVVVNLFNNAIQAMEEKGELTISLGSVELRQAEIPAQYEALPGRYAKMSVQDTGCGMPAEILKKIFDPFFSTKEEYEGAGMGLSTVYGIVAQHGGVIKVNSIPDQGTVFDLYFPILDAPEIEPKPIDTDISQGTEKILFVDDDEQLATIGEQILSEMGYQVTVMTESTEALKLFKANPDRFDLVITDQTMPDLTGEELIQELKKIKPDLKTILSTGYSTKIDKDQAKQQGIDAFCMKPLNLPEMLKTVRRVLGGNKE